jgi:hypothetical protein
MRAEVEIRASFACVSQKAPGTNDSSRESEDHWLDYFFLGAIVAFSTTEPGPEDSWRGASICFMFRLTKGASVASH